MPFCARPRNPRSGIPIPSGAEIGAVEPPALDHRRLRGALLGDLVQAPADLVSALADVVEPRQLREALEAEDPLEERRRAVADRAARRVVAPGLSDQAPLEEVGDGRVGRDAADARDVR